MDDTPIRYKRRQALSLSTILDKYESERSEKMTSPLKPKRPHSCDLLISERCNLRCKKCHFWQSDVKDSLTIKECKKIIDSLSAIGERPFEINLGGGEPLLVKGIIELIRYCVKKGLQPALSTNATLIDKTMAKKLSRSGLSRMSISLDSLDAKTHDGIVGVEGAYQKLMKGLEYLEKYWKTGHINVHTVLSELNSEGIIDLVEWVNQHKLFRGINIQAVSQPFRSMPEERWWKKEEYAFLWPKKKEKVNEVLDKLIELKKKGYKIINPLHQFNVYKVYYEHPEKFARKFRCNFGDHTLNVNALGLMHLCCFMKPLGSLRLSTVEELWGSPQAESTRYAMYNCRQSCNNIMNCFFEEEDIEAGFADEVSVKVEEKAKEVASSPEPKTPASAITFCNLNITPECQLPCRMCYIWKSRDKNRKVFKKQGLTLPELRWLLKDLGQIMQDEKRVYFSGGEPLIRKGIYNLIRFAEKQGLFTMLGTSCYTSNIDVAHKIADSGLRFLNVSLDSHLPKTHDYLRGKRGVYKRVMTTATTLNKVRPELDVGIGCVISKINLADILPLVDMAEKDERFSSIYFQALVQPYDTTPCNYWYRLDEYRFLWPDETGAVNEVLDELIRRKEDGNHFIGNSAQQLAIYKHYYNNPEELNRVKKCMRDDSSITIKFV